MGRLEEAVSSYKLGLEREPSHVVLKERLTQLEKELRRRDSEKTDLDNVANQMIAKLADNPRTVEWLKDPSFMTKLLML